MIDTKSLKDLIGEMPKEHLIELIEVMIQFNNQAEQALLDHCQAHGFQENRQLIMEKQLENNWNSVYGLIESADTYGGCSDEDEEIVYDTMNAMMDLLKENKLSWECRKEVLNEMLRFIGSDNSGFTDVLVDCAVELCPADIEKEYLAERLAIVGNRYYRGFATSLFRELGIDEKFLKTQHENLIYGSDYLSLAEYYEEKGQKDKALKWAWKGLNKCDGRLDEILHYLFENYAGDEATLWKLYEKAKTKKQDMDTAAVLMYAHLP